MPEYPKLIYSLVPRLACIINAYVSCARGGGEPEYPKLRKQWLKVNKTKCYFCFSLNINLHIICFSLPSLIPGNLSKNQGKEIIYYTCT